MKDIRAPVPGRSCGPGSGGNHAACGGRTVQRERGLAGEHRRGPPSGVSRCRRGRGPRRLPELASTIYPAFTNDPELFKLAEPEGGPSVTAAREIAREAGLALVYPFFEREGDHFYNSAVVFGRDGQRLTKYRKNTIPSGLDDWWEPAAARRTTSGPATLDSPWCRRTWGQARPEHLLRPKPARTGPVRRAERRRVVVRAGDQHAAGTLALGDAAVRKGGGERHVRGGPQPRRCGPGGAPEEFYFGESLIINPRGESSPTPAPPRKTWCGPTWTSTCWSASGRTGSSSRTEGPISTAPSGADPAGRGAGKRACRLVARQAVEIAPCVCLSHSPCTEELSPIPGGEGLRGA